MDTTETSQAHRASAVWGITAAAILAVFVFLPATFAIRQALDLPELAATPRHLREHSDPVPVSYWLTWIIALLALLSPTPVLALSARTRRVALGYALTATLLGGGLALLVIGFEVNGFAPD